MDQKSKTRHQPSTLVGTARTMQWTLAAAWVPEAQANADRPKVGMGNEAGCRSRRAEGGGDGRRSACPRTSPTALSPAMLHSFAILVSFFVIPARQPFCVSGVIDRLL